MGENTGSGASLEHELLRLVEQGIEISEDVLFYAESTCGLLPAEIESALRDVEFEQRDELLALILTPDMKMRTILEPLLYPSPSCSPAELETLVDGLSSKIGELYLLVAGGPGFNLPIERGDIDYFGWYFAAAEMCTPRVKKNISASSSKKAAAMETK